MVAEYFDNKDFQRMVQRAVCQAIYYESLRHDHMAGFMTDAFELWGQKLNCDTADFESLGILCHALKKH